jgi:SAM-dependent methyltransferase
MPESNTEDVVAMYAKYPYPSPTVGASLLYDLAGLFYLLFESDDLSGRKVLDAGCGTGQRILGLAEGYPKAHFVGIDVAETSLEIAARLAEKHGIRNIAFKKGDILNLDLGEEFDFIVSTGVVHHLEDPQKGLANLCRHLTADGVVCVWHYHPFGELDRLVGRELLMTLWGEQRSDLSKGQRIMEQLRLRLRHEQYGTTGIRSESDRDQLSVYADAFLHPIVNAYRFDEALAMFKGCEVDWVAISGVTTPQTMKLVDLTQVEEAARGLCLWDSDLFKEESLRSLYHTLSKTDKLRVIELVTKPTGFTILAGRGDAYNRLGRRIAGNVIQHEALPEPYPRMLRV